MKGNRQDAIEFAPKTRDSKSLLLEWKDGTFVIAWDSMEWEGSEPATKQRSVIYQLFDKDQNLEEKILNEQFIL